MNQGEKDLVYGVIQRALEDLQGDITDVCPKVRMKAQLSAKRWFKSNRTSPFSFIWCCDHIGLNPLAVREKISMVKSS